MINANFSPCRRYRYTLQRYWGGLAANGIAMFICLNPSTADETHDDPTIRRCIGYAKSWGYAGLLVGNLFAFRATKPVEMLACPAPIGEENDKYLRLMAETADVVVAAWGAHGQHLGRDQQVRAMFPCLHYLRLTKKGIPGHPLYLPKNLTLCPLE